MTQHCVIVGASHAASQLALSLRKLGWAGSITMIGEESHPPYHRPPLSKNYLTGGKQLQQILLRPPAAYEAADIDLVLSTRVDRIDRDARNVLLSSGDRIPYTHLVLATGARPRSLTVEDAGLPGVCYLRDATDIELIRQYAEPGARAVIVGGGYIGLEVAATLNKLDMKVTVLEACDRVLQRVTSPLISEFFAGMHIEEGVEIRTSAAVARIVGDDAVNGVVLSTDEVIDAQLVIVGIGVLPNTELASGSGLAVDNGIVVDEFGRTADPSIFACGDCANAQHGFYSRPLRLESVQSANDQALTVARSICDVPEACATVPWFWSDQYDVKLQVAGLQSDHDEVIVRRPANGERKFSVAYLRNSVLLSVDAINSPAEFVSARKLIAARAHMDAAKLCNANVKLTDCIAEQ